MSKVSEKKAKEIMARRTRASGAEWKKEGGGYYSGVGVGFAELAYVALPLNHPDNNKDYHDLNPRVNGGLTFGEGNVYGWDYAHFENFGTPQGDIKTALKYFRARARK